MIDEESEHVIEIVTLQRHDLTAPSVSLRTMVLVEPMFADGNHVALCGVSGGYEWDDDEEGVGEFDAGDIFDDED